MNAIEIPTPDPRSLDDEARPFAESIALHYALKREIGRGGNGVVYLARDRRLDRLVAIKTLPPHLAKDATVRERFLREARTAGAMSHPNIVSIHSAIETDAHVYFVMSLVEGESLAAHIRAHDRLPARVVACYLRDVASALVHAHSRGIIHRDIKAENVLVERGTGRALVTDFGIARIAEATPLTATGQLLGTVHYVSPEQVTGAVIDARSDLYSLGVLGFLAVSGRFPFQSELASAVLVSHVTKTAPRVSHVQADVPAPLAAIIDRCLEKDPAARFGSALELVAALESAIAGLDGMTTMAPIRETRVSDTEAHMVWKRAAELQALTGVQPRPTLIPGVRDAQRGHFGGMSVRDVREAAAEAGIDHPYVEHALMEIGVAPDGSALPLTAVASASVTARNVLMADSSTRFRSAQQFEVEGEVAATDLERLVHVVRNHTGVMGHSESIGRELTWWSGRFGGRLDVSVVPGDGRSVITLSKDLSRSVLLAAAGVLVTAGFGSGIMTLASVYELGGRDAEGIAETLGLAVGAATTFFATRAVVRLFHRRTAERLRALGAKLAERVREHGVRPVQPDAAHRVKGATGRIS